MTLTPRAAVPEPAMSLPPLLLRHVAIDAAQPELDLLADHGTGPSVVPEPAGETWIFSLTDLAADTDGPLAAALTVKAAPGTVELRSFAVHPDFPDGLVFTRLIAALADRFRAVGLRRVIFVDDRAEADRATLVLGAGFAVVEAEKADGMVAFELLL